MHDYFRLLSVLEQEAKRSSSLPITSSSAVVVSTTGTGDGNEEPSGLTLLRMRAWMQEPIDR